MSNKSHDLENMSASMSKFLVRAFLLMLFPVCSASAIELKASNDPADHPFGMAEFAAPEGLTKDE
jgi:hypothetical protein